VRYGAPGKFFYILSLVGIDVAAYTLAFFCAVQLRIFLGAAFEVIPDFSGDAMRFGDLYFMPGLFLLIFFYEGLYGRRAPYIDELRDIAKSIAMLTILLFALISVGKLTNLISRLTIVLMAPLAFIFVGAFRYWGKIILHRMGFGRQNLIIIGDVTSSLKIKAELLAERTLGYRYEGFVPIDNREKNLLKKIPPGDLKYAGDIQKLPEILRTHRVECALIAAPDLSREKISALADRVHRYVHHVLLIPEMRSGALLNSELYHLFVNQLFLIKMRNTLSERGARFSKLAFDYLLTLFSLPFIMPILLVIAVAIRLTSPGPALFSQQRVGQHGKIIRVYKFRSMYADAEVRLKELLASNASARAEWKKTIKLKNDPRITRLGAFLRKTSLDELPQLLNVLRGEMSLVGPRPVPATELNARYKDRSDYYKLVRPGMTGLWQISGRNDISYKQRVNMDTWYVFNWSLYIDLVILYKTVGVVLKKRGAY
jgi:Undecaprenyl-phosphate galactose phosphotransferase WbaP